MGSMVFFMRVSLFSKYRHMDQAMLNIPTGRENVPWLCAVGDGTQPWHVFSAIAEGFVFLS